MLYPTAAIFVVLWLIGLAHSLWSGGLLDTLLFIAESLALLEWTCGAKH